MNMDRFKFRVYYEAELHGKLHIGIESEASWFVLTQAGNLLVGAPCEPYIKPDNYKKLIPLACTGIKDKTGTLIYEGDIVEYKIPGIPKIRAVVEYNQTSGHYVKGCQDLATYQKSTVIIGNVYENQDLLKDCSFHKFD